MNSTGTCRSGLYLSLNHDIAETMKKIKQDVAEEVIERLKETMKEHGKVFTGYARDGFEYEDDYISQIVSKVPYYEHIDLGIPPNSGIEIDMDNLRNWVEFSGKVSHDGSEEQITSITYKIANKINTKGIYPTRITLKTLTDMERDYDG